MLSPKKRGTCLNWLAVKTRELIARTSPSRDALSKMVTLTPSWRANEMAHVKPAMPAPMTSTSRVCMAMKRRGVDRCARWAVRKSLKTAHDMTYVGGVRPACLQCRYTNPAINYGRTNETVKQRKSKSCTKNEICQKWCTLYVCSDQVFETSPLWHLTYLQLAPLAFIWVVGGLRWTRCCINTPLQAEDFLIKTCPATSDA